MELSDATVFILIANWNKTAGVQVFFFSNFGDPYTEVHSTKEIIVIMWACHLKRHALAIPLRSNSFISMCIFQLIDDFIIKAEHNGFSRTLSPPYLLSAYYLNWESHIQLIKKPTTSNMSRNTPISRQGRKCKNSSICGNSTSCQHFFSESVWSCT